MAFPETTIQADFYSPWPKFGKSFSKQLDESRSNTNSLNPIVRAIGLDSNYVNVAGAAVQAVEIGETDFHNKYRIFWDKTNDTFRIQINTGTSGTPLWTDSISIGPSGEVVGNFYVPSENLPTDHGALTGLSDDDHTQYLLASDAGSRALFSTNWTDLTDAGSTVLHTHDHGGLGGLADDDHTQYLLASDAGSRALFSTNWTDLTDGGATTLHTHADSGGVGGGFYGINVKQTDGKSYKGINTINFEASSFYVEQNSTNTDEVSVNFRGTAGSGSGVSDHGALTGLADDDHPQYARKAASQVTFDGNITAEAFYLREGEISSSGSTMQIFPRASLFVDVNNGSIDFEASSGGAFTTGGAFDMESTGSSLSFTANTAISVDAGTSLNISATTAATISGSSVTLSDGIGNTLLLGRSGVNISDIVKAEAFYIPGGQVVHVVTTDDLEGSIITPVEYRKPILKFNRRDFYLTADTQGNPIVNAAAIGGSGSVSNTITVKDGSLPNYVTSELNFNPNEFYLTGTSGGQPMVNLVGATSEGDGGTALTVADQLAPTFTNTSKITFDRNFYLTPDSTGQPIVNFVSFFNEVIVSQTTNQTISASTATDLIFGQVISNFGGWGVNLGTGEITVPAGVTHVKLSAQTRMQTPTATGRLSVTFRKNGAGLGGTGPAVANTGHFVATIASPALQTVSPFVPVVEGDILTLNIFHTLSATLATDSSSNSTYMAIEGYNFG